MRCINVESITVLIILQITEEVLGCVPQLAGNHCFGRIFKLRTQDCKISVVFIKKANGPLNLDRIPSVTSSARGTIFCMAEKGIPVIHILNIKRLSDKYHVATYIGQDNLDLAFSNAQESHLIITALVLLVWVGLCLATLIPRAHLPFSRR